MENVLKFEHTSEKINEAFGLTYEQDTKCREIIFFSAFSNYLIGNELFDDDSERPKALSTITGDLEKALSLVDTEKEKYYTLFLFRSNHDLALDVIAKYKVLEMAGSGEKKKIELILQLLELKLEEKKKEDAELEYHSPSEMFKKIEFVKKSRYNFKKYLELLAADEKS